jgi:hypothetical protein
MKSSKFLSSTAACPNSGERGLAVLTISITIHPTKRPDYFEVRLDSEILVKSSRQPRCDAARVLHRRGLK